MNAILTNMATEQAPARIRHTMPLPADVVAEMAQELTAALAYDESATYYVDGADDDDEPDEPNTSTPGAWRIVATVHADNDSSINDCDAYGRVEWSRRRHHSVRPAGFDGSARIIVRDGYDDLWWQPYRDEDGRVYASPVDESNVRRLVTEGFHGIVVIVQELTVWQTTTADGRVIERREWREVGSDSLWGIDDDGRDQDGKITWQYRREIVADMIEEAVGIATEQAATVATR